VLWAVSDAKYTFLYINVGAKGSASDGGIFNACALSTALMRNTLNIPDDRPLPGRTMPIPFELLADDAFPASVRILKPISRQNLSRMEMTYNSLISRGRGVIDNAFGIASARRRIVRKTSDMSYTIIALANHFIY